MSFVFLRRRGPRGGGFGAAVDRRADDHLLIVCVTAVHSAIERVGEFSAAEAVNEDVR